MRHHLFLLLLQSSSKPNWSNSEDYGVVSIFFSIVNIHMVEITKNVKIK